MTRKPTLPGKILLEDFLTPYAISQTQFAAHIGVSRKRIGKIISGKAKIDVDLALRFSAAFGNSAQFWLHAQMAADLHTVRKPTNIKKLCSPRDYIWTLEDDHE